MDHKTVVSTLDEMNSAAKIPSWMRNGHQQNSPGVSVPEPLDVDAADTVFFKFARIFKQLDAYAASCKEKREGKVASAPAVKRLFCEEEEQLQLRAEAKKRYMREHLEAERRFMRDYLSRKRERMALWRRRGLCCEVVKVDLTCKICTNIILKNVYLEGCFHILCEPCFSKYCRGEAGCPVCKGYYSKKNQIPIDAVLDEVTMQFESLAT